MATDPELDEKNFVQERGSKFVWTFLLLFILFVLLMWGITFWQRSLSQKHLEDTPFYQVTNREFSIFLWQNPQFMRAHVDLSEAYLPHFHSKGDIHMIPEFADTYVVAPPNILYRYHAWKRLIGDFVATRPIEKVNFQVFLDSNTEWYPRLWKNAPEGYQDLIKGLENLDVSNLQTLSYEELPLEVRMAYMGWFNYNSEWNQINLFSPPEKELTTFLEGHSHYAQNYWRNLEPNYLLTPSDLPWFLKSAVFNYLQSQIHL